MRAVFALTCVVGIGCGQKPDVNSGPKDGESPPATEDKSKQVTPAAPARSETVYSSSGVAPGDEDLSKVKPDFTMTAKELKAFFDDPPGRDAKHRKVIEVSGVVCNLSFTKEKPVNTYLSLLDPGSTPGRIVNIDVLVEVNGTNAWRMVLPGQSVVLRARYDSSNFGNLWKCQIISVSGRSHLQFTVDQMIEVLKKDKEVPKNLSDPDRQYVFTGNVIAVRPDESRDQKTGMQELVMTQPGSDIHLLLRLDIGNDPSKFNAIQAGQTVRVLGYLSSISLQGNKFEFRVEAVLEVKSAP